MLGSGLPPQISQGTKHECVEEETCTWVWKLQNRRLSRQGIASNFWIPWEGSWLNDGTPRIWWQCTKTLLIDLPWNSSLANEDNLHRITPPRVGSELELGSVVIEPPSPSQNPQSPAEAVVTTISASPYLITQLSNISLAEIGIVILWADSWLLVSKTVECLPREKSHEFGLWITFLAVSLLNNVLILNDATKQDFPWNWRIWWKA